LARTAKIRAEPGKAGFAKSGFFSAPRFGKSHRRQPPSLKNMKHILVTGATGKVGSHFIRRILASRIKQEIVIRALCHNRVPSPHEGMEIVEGSIADRETVRTAMRGITHVIHCATCKETPDQVIDVTVKGLFWLLEEARASSSFRQIILIGGDAA